MAQTPPFTATKATGSWGWLPGNRTSVLGSCPLSCSPTSVSPFVMMSPSPPRLLCSVAEQSFSHKERFGLLWLKMRTSLFVLERFHLVIATPVKWASYVGPDIDLLHRMSFPSFSRITTCADCGERGRRKWGRENTTWTWRPEGPGASTVPLAPTLTPFTGALLFSLAPSYSYSNPTPKPLLKRGK